MAALTDSDVEDLDPLRYVRSITAPLSPLQAQRFSAKYPVFVLNGYGQAEIGEVIGWTAADGRDHADKVGAAGRPHPGVDIRIVDGDGAPVPAGAVGALRVRPPRMAAGYAGGADLRDRLDVDGFVDTGDLARVDDEGFVWIEGRAGDVINRGGNKVFPEHVEEVLRLSPGVADAAVVGQPDERLGEVPVAYVVTAGGPVTDEELDALCRQHLVPYKVPVAFRRVDALPRNDAGKLLRARLAPRGDAGQTT
jgi:acyl-coenzyme A synthetase/AMP-(fatty) acid ligase